MTALLPLPAVRQTAAHDCGAAVFRCVTRYWEGRGRRVKSDALYGTHPDQLEPAFRAAGYSCLSGELDVPALRAITKIGWPVCCLIQVDGVGHWVVVRGVYRGRVHFMDPADGFRWLPSPEWERNWTDGDRRGTVFRQYGLAVWC